MSRILAAIFIAILAAGCQTTTGTALTDPDAIHQAGVSGPKPSVLTTKPIPQAKAEAKKIFTSPMQGFRVIRETNNRLLFGKTLPANVNDNNPLKGRTKGAPVGRLELTFTNENGKTRVTGDNWVLLNPKGKNKDPFNLLATPDGPRLQRKLNELK
ncbi:hypothetical protein [Roseibium sp. RKSG952]|uniref:hypothetical protein n=1 Tax=Roseibium sp. RKSG952 TaxID=2529384 RepID=UPI0012BBC188|nr:hypothetical protein [Roseibium sp. RKSG952]MTH94996.1 hypothetical protein [Roseibium sp. RKSG952]